MNNVGRYDSILAGNVETACQRIAPLWPLKNFVAVNPYFGLGDKTFWQADQLLERVAGKGLVMPRAYYREQIADGRIRQEDLEEALTLMGSTWDRATL